jgi:hypothetical protein
MPGHYIVLHSAILGPPHTARTFQAGELVSEADFANCPAQWERLERLKAIRPALPHEHAEAMGKRERNLKSHLGLDSNASVAHAEEILRLRREHTEQSVAEAKRRFAGGSPPAPASRMNATGIPDTPVGYPSEGPVVPPGVSPAVQAEAAAESEDEEGESSERTGHRRRRRGQEE